MSNLVDLNEHHQDFKIQDITFSVSSRNLTSDMHVLHYLKVFYMYLNIESIESIFGNTTFFSPLYGGRSFKLDRSINERHISELEKLGIGLALTMTNHYFSDEVYESSKKLFEWHHKKGNSIICTNDELAMRIRRDFPNYTIKASIIKNINSLEKIDQAFQIYDLITLPMDLNDDDEFLEKIRNKDRIILFGNANCAYTCPARSCYLGFSQKYMDKPVTSFCSKKKILRLDKGGVYFDIAKLKGMGFNQFKLIPLAHQATRSISIALGKRSERVGSIINKGNL